MLLIKIHTESSSATGVRSESLDVVWTTNQTPLFIKQRNHSLNSGASKNDTLKTTNAIAEKKAHEGSDVS